MKKRIVCFLVLAAMTLGLLAGCGKSSNESTETNVEEAKEETKEEAKEDLEWLNTSGTLPIVKEGVEKTLTIAVMSTEAPVEMEDSWFYKFIEENMNINLEVVKFTPTNKDQYLTTLFVDDNLPDIIIGGGFQPTDLMTYGASEGQLMDLAPYITEELMPRLYKIYEENPSYKMNITDSEGHVWSLGYINDPAEKGQIPRMFINYDWLEEEGLNPPETTEELLEVLRAFKKRGNDVLPLAGSAAANTPLGYILNAFGYNNSTLDSNQIALRNGKVVLPIADREAYGAYLEYVHTLYDEGLIHPDFYTMDATTTNAIISAGNAGFISQAPLVFLPEEEDYEEFWGALPLTSAYNEEAFWAASMGSISCGGFVVSAKCEEPELAMAFADWFFDEANYEMSVNGPCDVQSDILYGVEPWHVDPETMVVSHPSANCVDDGYTMWTYKILGLGNISGICHQKMAGIENPSDGYLDVSAPGIEPELRKNSSGSQDHFRSALKDTFCPYVENGYPSAVYLDSEKSVEVGNLLTAIREYGNVESAKFITGARPLDELDEYFDEIERLGALEVVQVYQDIYDSLQ